MLGAIALVPYHGVYLGVVVNDSLVVEPIPTIMNVALELLAERLRYELATCFLMEGRVGASV